MIKSKIMKKIIILNLLLTSSLFSQDYYYEKYAPFDENIKSPEEFLGYPIGEMHTRHDQIVSYMEYLSNISDKAQIFYYGETYEKRKLVILAISSSDKILNLEKIRENHISYLDPKHPNYSEKSKPVEIPVIINLAYSVHGNEPSTSEAALLTAYTLIGSKSDEISKYLSDSIILIDPTLNPDGRDRHTHWVNTYKGSPLVDDPQDAEHNEYWPGGRTNHYWFDLNRDWYLGINPESRSKLKWYHSWKPNVTADFHEMGTNSTYFFVPFKPNGSLNPVIPKENYEYFNFLFGTYFADALDEIGTLYFTRERFDRTYPGYGSAYPDYLGGIGLLFEQASSRGHKQKTQFGEITFPFTIKNQYVSGMTTIKASVANKEKLKNYQSNFYKSAITESTQKRVKGYTFNKGNDNNKTKAFIDKLKLHNIDVLRDGNKFYVPTVQKNYRLVRSFFETHEKYRDSVFYDASAWSMANIYDIDYSSSNKDFEGEEVENIDGLFQVNSFSESNYAYILDSQDYNIPAITYDLLSNEVFTSASFKPFTIQTSSGVKTFNYGSLIIPLSIQKKLNSNELYEKMMSVQKKYNVNIYSVQSGLSATGIDLGSGYVMPINKPNAMMLIGTGVRAYEAGEVWHLLDQRVGMPITKIPMRNFDNISMDKYNVLVLVSGDYKLSDSQIQKIKTWAENGNTIISIGSGSKLLIENKIVDENLLEKEEFDEMDYLAYGDAEENRDKEQIGGVILNSIIDLTHPLAFGYENNTLPVYKNNSIWLKPSKNSYSSVVRYSDDPLIDGFLTEKNKSKINKSVSLVVSKVGSGIAVMFADNPNFRGAWYGTNRLFLNAIFLGDKIDIP